MRLQNVVRFGAAALVAMTLAACDGSENARTQPTAAPDYVSPAMIGPEAPEAIQHGEAEGDEEGHGGEENQEETEGATEGGAEATTEAE